MRAKCSAYGCKAASYNKFGYILSFHRLPKDPERQQQWKDFCKNPRATNKDYKSFWLCSAHFEKSCFCNYNTLNSNAIPTISTSEAEFRSNYEVDADGESSRDAKSIPSESLGMNIQKEAPTLVIDEEDECESVHFSSDEDKDLDSEARMDWKKGDESSEDVITIEQEEIECSTGPSLTQPGTSAISAPVEPVYTKLPSVSPLSKTQTSSQQPGLRQPSKSLFKRSVLDKAAEESIELSDEEDDCSTFAAHIKTRMRNFNQVQKAIAQKLISDIMFMADTRQLKLDTAIVIQQSRTLASTSQVNNGVPQKTGGSFFAYIDSDDDDCPLPKRPK